MTRTTLAAVALALVTTATVVAAQGGQRQRPTQPAPAPPATSSVTYSRADAELIARHLYKAILGRDADPSGLTVATADIQAGRLASGVQGMFDSDEFVKNVSNKPAAVILEQFYRGLLNRSPDTAGVQDFLPRVERRQYAAVIVQMVGSPEFRRILTSPPASAPAPQAPKVTASDAAFACQVRVVETMRQDAGGRVFVSFDRFPDVSADGQTVSGPGVDRFDSVGRPLTYRCAGNNVTYSFRDGKGANAADTRLRFPSAAVVNCQNAVRQGLIFDSAAMTKSDSNQDWILGVSNGKTSECQINDTRVVLVK